MTKVPKLFKSLKCSRLRWKLSTPAVQLSEVPLFVGSDILWLPRNPAV